MKRRGLILLIGMILMIMVAASAVSAQDIDISSMDNTQLAALLQQILNKLQQEEDPGTVVPDETPALTAEQQKPKHSIWDNKKLMIEALPSYMFVPKVTEEPETGPQDPGKPKKENKYDPTIHTNGEPCTSDGAHWYFLGGEWRCMYG